MRDEFNARRLEHEVDGIMTAALNAGCGGRISLEHNGHARTFVVDRVVSDDSGYPAEIWLSSESIVGFFTRLVDRFRGVCRRDLLRVRHDGGDVRRSITTVEVGARGITHIGFREDVGAPRVSRSIATFRYPTSDATTWLQTYRRAS